MTTDLAIPAVATAFNELNNGANWDALLPGFRVDEAQALTPEQLRSETLIHDWDTARPWPLDPLPFLLSDAEWINIDQALVQRANLLNAILTELYGSRAFHQTSALPPGLAYGNPRYLLPCIPTHPPNDCYLSLIAFDLGRGPDGRWRVLADWTEAPQGYGMCIENRIVTGQALPGQFQTYNTQRLAEHLQDFAHHLNSQVSTTPESGITVILSDGPDHESYFEQAYLGQYFGFPIIDGADLTVRGQHTYLKTLEGLKKVESILRFPNAELCDPLYLDANTIQGTPGLVQSSGLGNVLLCNALGSGVLECDAWLSFLPGLCEQLLNEPLAMPNIATWWCGQPDEHAYVIEHAHSLRLTSAYRRPNNLMQSLDSIASKGNDVDPANCAPYELVAREPLMLSQAPYINPQGLVDSAPIVLRVFVHRSDKGYRTLPGGIVRASTAHGEICKDVWIAQSAVQSTPTPVPSPVRTNRSDRDLPSRTADDLYWLGRYLERCENAVRTYRALFELVAEQSSDEQANAEAISAILAELGMLDAAEIPAFLNNLQTNAAFRASTTLFDDNAPFGLRPLLHTIEQLANQVRERLSADAWRLFQALSRAPSEVYTTTDAIDLLNLLIRRLSGLSGQVHENMTRGYGWRLIEMGKRLERTLYNLNIIAPLMHTQTPSSYLFLLLKLSDTAITYRARYQTRPSHDAILDLLLLDESNPRSTAFQILKLREIMQAMPMEQEGDGLSESQRILLSAYHELQLAQPEKLVNSVGKTGTRTQLRRVLNHTRRAVERLSQIVTARYFAHVHGPDRQ